MNIPFTYEIISADSVARCMEVVYSSEGRDTIHVSARLPYVGESLEAVIHMYSPVIYWQEKERELQVPVVGTTGAFNLEADVPTLESVKKTKKAEIAQWRYGKEVSGVLVNGVRIETDRVSQATINAAYVSLRDNIVSSIDWKTATGSFAAIGITEITAISAAVVKHVQQSFTLEMQYCNLVDAATTIDEVRAITLPMDTTPEIPTTFI